MPVEHEKERLRSLLSSVEKIVEELSPTIAKNHAEDAAEMQAIVLNLLQRFETAKQNSQIWLNRAQSAKDSVHTGLDPVGLGVEECEYLSAEYRKISERLLPLIQSSEQSLKRIAYEKEYSRVSKLSVSDATDELAIWRKRLQACRSQHEPDPKLIDQLEAKIKVFVEVFGGSISEG